MASRTPKLVTVEQALDELPTTLHKAMALAFAEIEGATKAALNPHFGKKYADIGAVIDAIKPPLIRYGLFFTQRNQPSNGGVTVDTVLHHSSGEEMPLGSLFVPADKNDAQKFGSALTYARRYALMTAFGVPAEDDDGNAAARPSVGAARPENSADDRLPVDAGRSEGEMSSSALRGSLRMLVHHINGCGTTAELEDLLDTADAKEVIDNCQRRFPAWWETGENMPSEFVPLKKLIEQTRKGLAELEPAE